MDKSCILHLDNVSKIYKMGAVEVAILLSDLSVQT